MKKSNAILLLILLFSVINIYGKSKEYISSYPDTLKLKLLKTTKHNLQVNCVDLGNKLYFIDDFSLAKEDIKKQKVCFFLNTDFEISDIQVQRENVALRLHKFVRCNDFSPEINEQVFSDINHKTKIYELVFKDIDDFADSIDIKLKYHFLEKDSLAVNPEIIKWIDFKGSEFWYPRNIYANEDVSLLVKTVDVVSFYLSGKSIDYSQNRYLKEYSISITDVPEDPAVLMFRKTELK